MGFMEIYHFLEREITDHITIEDKEEARLVFLFDDVLSQSEWTSSSHSLGLLRVGQFEVVLLFKRF